MEPCYFRAWESIVVRAIQLSSSCRLGLKSALNVLSQRKFRTGSLEENVSA